MVIPLRTPLNLEYDVTPTTNYGYVCAMFNRWWDMVIHLIGIQTSWLSKSL